MGRVVVVEPTLTYISHEVRHLFPTSSSEIEPERSAVPGI